MRESAIDRATIQLQRATETLKDLQAELILAIGELQPGLLPTGEDLASADARQLGQTARALVGGALHETRAVETKLSETLRLMRRFSEAAAGLQP